MRGENGRSCTVRSFIVCSYSTPDVKADEVNANEVDGKCGTQGKGAKSVQGFGGKSEGTRPLGRMGSEWILGRLAGVSAEWI
jgi:hypothetical protein